MESATAKELDSLKMLKALADPNRLRIVKRISRQDDVCALELLDDLKITQPTLSHHMKTLVECGLVESRKAGRWRRYSLRSSNADAFLKDLADTLQS